MIHAVHADALGSSPDRLNNGHHSQGRVGDFVANPNLIVAMAYGRLCPMLDRCIP
jgi:hypothetical protein